MPEPNPRRREGRRQFSARGWCAPTRCATRGSGCSTAAGATGRQSRRQCALMAAKLRSPGEQAVTEIDAALREIRRDEPAIDTVEKGLKGAKAAGVPVDLEGPKPPASALAVTKTGFGPGVGGREEAGPAGQAGAGGHPARQGRGEGRQAGRAGKGGRCGAAAGAGTRRAAAAARAAGSCADDRGQAPAAAGRRRPATRPERGPGLRPGQGQCQGLREGQEGAPAGRVEGQGGAGRRAGPDRRPGRSGQGRQGRRDGRPAGGVVRQEGVHRGGQGRDRGEITEDAEGGRQVQGIRQGR